MERDSNKFTQLNYKDIRPYEKHTMILNSLKSQWISPCSARRTIKPITVSKIISGFCNCLTCTLIEEENKVRMHLIYLYCDGTNIDFKILRNKRTRNGRKKRMKRNYKKGSEKMRMEGKRWNITPRAAHSHKINPKFWRQIEIQPSSSRVQLLEIQKPSKVNQSYNISLM